MLAKKTKNEGDQKLCVSLTEVVSAQFHTCMSSGWVAAVKKEIMKLIQYAIFWEKTQIMKNISGELNVTKNAFFSKELQHSSQHSF